MAERIIIFDTTLRDGEQSPGASMNKAEKLRLARQLEKLKVDVIEAGFPVASQGDFEAVALIAKEVRGLTVTALCRTEMSDIDRAWEAVKSRGRPPAAYLYRHFGFAFKIQTAQDPKRGAGDYP